jgi:hypothetical protein
MVDNWIDCPHCGRNVISYPDECSVCGRDKRILPDGRPNPGQENRFLKAMQAGSIVDKIVFAVILLVFAGMIVRSWFGPI